jgi:hypothetical protein
MSPNKLNTVIIYSCFTAEVTLLSLAIIPGTDYFGNTIWDNILAHLRVCNHAYGPKNKCRCCNAFIWLFFSLQRKKVYTVLYYNIQCTVGFLNAKNPLLGGGGWPSVEGVNLTPLWIYVKSGLLRFPQAIGLTPSPSLSLLTPSHFVTQFQTRRRRYWHIGGLLHPIH